MPNLGSTGYRGGPPPSNVHTSVGSGALDDAKIYELAFTLAASERGRVFDIDANAFYMDNGPTAIGSVQFQIDECTPMVQIKYGMFFRTRRFTRIRFDNL